MRCTIEKSCSPLPWTMKRRGDERSLQFMILDRDGNMLALVEAYRRSDLKKITDAFEQASLTLPTKVSTLKR